MAGRRRRLVIFAVLLVGAGAAIWHLFFQTLPARTRAGRRPDQGEQASGIRIASPNAEAGGFASESPDARGHPLPARAGDIALVGRVLDVGGGVVPGARVEARAIDRGAFPPSPVAHALAMADQEGVYRLGLPAGHYLLVARSQGYAPAYDWVGLVTDTSRDLHLAPAARIAGRVIERSSRQPVAEASLFAIRDRPSPGGAMPQCLTDAHGRFELPDLDPGVYRLQARKGRLLGASGAIAVAATDVALGIEILVDPGLVIEGRVIDPQRQGVLGADVSLDRSGPIRAPPITAVSGKDGAFRLEGVWPGPVRLAARAPGRVPAKLELVVSRDQRGVELRLQAGASVMGQVLGDDGTPVSGAEVQAHVQPQPGPGPAVSTLHLPAHQRATTDQDGRFLFEALPAGQVNLDARHPARGAASPDRFSLAEGEKKSVVVRLAAGGLVEGTVRTATGAPAPGARVTILGTSAGSYATTTALAEGRFRFANLSPGSYTVVAAIGGGTAFGGPDRPDRTSFDLSAREREQVDLVVDGGESITGVVLGPDGQPVQGAEVTASAGHTAQVGRRALAAARGFADADGAFELPRLGAGPYTLFIESPGFADLSLGGVAGGKEGLVLRLAPESTLAGVVVAPSGRPVQHYAIYLTPAPPPGETAVQKVQRRRLGPTGHPADLVHDRSGRFFFGRVGPGKYTLEVIAADGSRGSLNIEVARGERREGLRVVSTDPARSAP